MAASPMAAMMNMMNPQMMMQMQKMMQSQGMQMPAGMNFQQMQKNMVSGTSDQFHYTIEPYIIFKKFYFESI